MSSYEAVQMFLQAKETLVVELSRKKNNLICASQLSTHINRNTNCEQDDSAICNKVENFQVSNATATCASRSINSSALPQPNTKNELILTLRVIHDLKPTIDDVEPTVVSKETQTIDNFFDVHKNIDHNKDIAQTIADHFIEQQHHLFEQCLEPEIDIEVRSKIGI